MCLRGSRERENSAQLRAKISTKSDLAAAETLGASTLRTSRAFRNASAIGRTINSIV